MICPDADTDTQGLAAGELAETMGPRIKALREGLGLSQSGLAASMRMQQGPVSMWESGRAVPVKYLVPLALALSTNVPYLMTGVGDPATDSNVPALIDAALEEARGKVALAMGVDPARISVRFDVVQTSG